MKKYIYNILVEPKGQIYKDLVDYALGECPYFLLVGYDEQKQLSQRGKEILNELCPYLWKKEMKSEWPGTVIFGGKEQIYYYHFSPESASVLKKSASRLFQWQIPELPIDLSLLRLDESPWLVTIAHENEAYFILDKIEMQRLLEAIPSFASMIEVANELITKDERTGDQPARLRNGG